MNSSTSAPSTRTVESPTLKGLQMDDKTKEYISSSISTIKTESEAIASKWAHISPSARVCTDHFFCKDHVCFLREPTDIDRTMDKLYRELSDMEWRAGFMVEKWSLALNPDTPFSTALNTLTEISREVMNLRDLEVVSIPRFITKLSRLTSNDESQPSNDEPQPFNDESQPSNDESQPQASLDRSEWEPRLKELRATLRQVHYDNWSKNKWKPRSRTLLDSQQTVDARPSD